jgi:hypothetical protein
MSKLNPLYERWDIKYFYKLHLERMEQMGEVPVSYPRFYVRLKNWMMLRDAIYTPSKTNMIRNKHNMKPNKLKNIRFRFISFFK